MGWSSIRTFQVEGIVHEGRFRNRKGQHNEKKNLDVNMVFVGTIRAGMGQVMYLFVPICRYN